MGKEDLVGPRNAEMRAQNASAGTLAVETARILKKHFVSDAAIGMAAINWQETSSRTWRTLKECEGLPCVFELGGAHAIPYSVWQDKSVRDFFMGNNKGGKVLVDHALPDGRMHVRSDVLLTESTYVADYVEQAIALRKEKMLEIVSIGPTQQFLKFLGKRAYWPRNIDEVYDMWITEHEAQMWTNVLMYLTHEGGEWQSSNPDASTFSWAAVQTGSTSLGADYATGTGFWSSTNGGLRAKVQYIMSKM